MYYCKYFKFYATHPKRKLRGYIRRLLIIFYVLHHRIDEPATPGHAHLIWNWTSLFSSPTLQTPKARFSKFFGDITNDAWCPARAWEVQDVSFNFLNGGTPRFLNAEEIAVGSSSSDNTGYFWLLDTIRANLHPSDRLRHQLNAVRVLYKSSGYWQSTGWLLLVGPQHRFWC